MLGFNGPIVCTPSFILAPRLYHCCCFSPWKRRVMSSFDISHSSITFFSARLSLSPHRNYPDYDYSRHDNDNRRKIAPSQSCPTPGRLWPTEKQPANVSPISFFWFPLLASLFPSVFFHFLFGFLYFCSLSTDFYLHSSVTFCLFSVFFNFLPVFHLCCCAPSNLLPLRLTLATCLRLSLCSSWFSLLSSFDHSSAWTAGNNNNLISGLGENN